ncbi:DnaD and phage-associated domain-containing protein [Dethiosulfatibacter aminovorans DSM 17477]|uniref:DnaD and phage-associated domain-containing protein n=1 Tax=Dethiosulfatibacter aminovorans DSM 17477 TaxID=1121476 RepID=A0A1M6HZJ5_9FIRM|nr:DnaD domain protein [Dethiosulfatibacter aminovorans]SHJ27652.1 DnaD and phage-associated domain-containing protein [Dethiosulfatibacter aminovorans DSM 17477]
MIFKLQNEKIDFGNTPVENIFINDYMPMAKGIHVKVYLLGYKYAKDREETFSNETIAKNLGISLKEVYDSWEYWQDQGIVVITGDRYSAGSSSVEFVNLKQLYVENIYKYVPDAGKEEPKEEKLSLEDAVSANKSESVRKMFRDVEFVFGRLLTPNEKRNILDSISKYSSTTEMVYETFKYAVEKKNVKNMRYVESLLASWYDKEIFDIDSLRDHLGINEKNYKYYNTVRKHLGFSGRSLTLEERNLIDCWVDQWHFSEEMIIKALSYSTGTTNPNMKYFNKILENWYSKGISKVEDIQSFDKKPRKKQSATTKNAFHNFEQKYSKMSEDELEKLAKFSIEDLIDDKEDI